MSKLENRILAELNEYKINYETQVPVPIEKYPWKTERTKTSPKCDIYLPEFDIFIEVKGFMTYQAVSKLSYLSRQDFKYYIFQGTEPQWNPYIDSYLPQNNENLGMTKKSKMDNLINFQINELVNLKESPDNFRERISDITLKRLQNYISIKIKEYIDWNGQWY